MIRAKKPKNKAKDWVKRYQDLLEIARLVSWCMNWDYLIKTCLDHISQRLGKRARYFLMEGDELKLHCWVGRYECDRMTDRQIAAKVRRYFKEKSTR